MSFYFLTQLISAVLMVPLHAEVTPESWIDGWSQSLWMLKQNNDMTLQLKTKDTITDEEGQLKYQLVLPLTNSIHGSPVVIELDASRCDIEENGAGQCPFLFKSDSPPLLDVLYVEADPSGTDDLSHTLVFDPKSGKDTAELKFIVGVEKNGESHLKDLTFEYGGHPYIRTKKARAQPLFKQLTRWFGSIDSSPHWKYWYVDYAWDDNTYIWELKKDLTKAKGNMVQMHIRTWGPSYAPELDILIDDCELTHFNLLGSCTFNITSEVYDFLGFMNSNEGNYVDYIDDRQNKQNLSQDQWQKIKDNKSFKHTIESSAKRGHDNKTLDRSITLTFDDGEGGTARFVVKNSDKRRLRGRETLFIG